MSIQENQQQIKMYGFFQKLVYSVVLLDIISLFVLGTHQTGKLSILGNLLKKFADIGVFYPPMKAKIVTIFLIIIVAIGTKAKKKQDLNIVKAIIIPIVIGVSLIFSSLMFTDGGAVTFSNGQAGFNMTHILYAIFSIVGAVLTQMGADAISKIIQLKSGKDRWNTEEESFDQNRELINTETSVNIPYLFRYNRKNNKGWMNINPFRGTMVIGTPGSGKSFGVINPAIRQLVQKGFCLCIYDFKFPDLAQIAYYHYLVKKQKDKDYKHKFQVINLNEVEKSRRVNPFNKKYVRTLAEAQEMAEVMVASLQKGGGSAGGGFEAFFTQSAINFLACSIYYFAKFENGRYSDLPHILSFMNKSYEEIFTTLFTNEELESLLSPFKSAFENKAFDQLEGQVGTLKIFLSKLATKESFWVFSGDEVELKITDKEEPSIMILASDPATQDINSALYASILNRTIKLINSKHNIPGGIIADEFPTIFIHKVDNLIATARSNKIAVILGLQEIPQLRQFYKKEVADTITSIIGNVLSGSVRDKNTLDWLERMFGKIKQKSYSQSISSSGTTQSINEKMDNMIPAGKIAGLRTGEMVGMLAGGGDLETDEYKTSAVSGKITLNMKEIQEEEANYIKLPTYYSFMDEAGNDMKDEVLMANFRRINNETQLIIQESIKA